MINKEKFSQIVTSDDKKQRVMRRLNLLRTYRNDLIDTDLKERDAPHQNILGKIGKLDTSVSHDDILTYARALEANLETLVDFSIADGASVDHMNKNPVPFVKIQIPSKKDNEEKFKRIADRIYAVQKLKRLSHEDLRERSGLSSMHTWKNDRHSVKQRTLEKFAKALGLWDRTLMNGVTEDEISTLKNLATGFKEEYIKAAIKSIEEEDQQKAEVEAARKAERKREAAQKAAARESEQIQKQEHAAWEEYELGRRVSRLKSAARVICTLADRFNECKTSWRFGEGNNAENFHDIIVNFLIEDIKHQNLQYVIDHTIKVISEEYDLDPNFFWSFENTTPRHVIESEALQQFPHLRLLSKENGVAQVAFITSLLTDLNNRELADGLNLIIPTQNFGENGIKISFGKDGKQAACLSSTLSRTFEDKLKSLKPYQANHAMTLRHLFKAAGGEPDEAFVTAAIEAAVQHLEQ